MMFFATLYLCRAASEKTSFADEALPRPDTLNGILPQRPAPVPGNTGKTAVLSSVLLWFIGEYAAKRR
jgi:hypothetical protein